MRNLWQTVKDSFGRIENKAGLYFTVIFHLTVIIVLLIFQIDNALKREESFVLDFSGLEEIERREREEAIKEDLSRKLEEVLSAAQQQDRSEIRNIAVDAGEQRLRDDRGTDLDQLNRDIERLARELREGQSNALEEDARNETVEMQHQNKTDKGDGKTYSGPSVVSYTLDGRKASHLPIPAYRCYGAGDVTVIITVNPQGQVINAKVMEAVSSTDQCLRNFAVRAARLSRFSISTTAPAKQTGEIVYRFIAQ